METSTKMIVSELSQGYELARELQSHLKQASVELCKSLVQEILASFEKSISMAKSNVSSSNLPVGDTESSRSFSHSPCGENSEQPFKAERKEMGSKKRKTQGKWTRQVRLGTGPEAEGALDDGYSWRKYGQKEILGAKHPRGYYRCTHRKSQSCLAMKQVQRSDANPLIFEVTYRGNHTCQQKPSPPIAPQPIFPNPNNQHMLLNFQTKLKVETENLYSNIQDLDPSSFSFPPTPVNNQKPENHIFSPSSALENCFKNNFVASFISSATSDSNYFLASPFRMSGYGAPSFQTSESADFTEIVSATTSASNSPMLDLDFMLDEINLDQDFSLDTYSFLP